LELLLKIKRKVKMTRNKVATVEMYLKKCQARSYRVLNKLLPQAKQQPKHLHAAMRYSALNGGKRIRAALVYAVGDALHGEKKVLDIVAAAIEMMHAFTLIHDDLPAIDNDDLRRGKPSCHRAFNEATAILAGDALQALSFTVLADLKLAPALRVKMVSYLGHAIGSKGVIGGELIDIEMENKVVTLQEINECYKLKTSKLLCASLILGALAANCTKPSVLHNLEKFGYLIGLVFQIHDDIIGVESDTKTLGKQQGSDEIRNKPTYPSLLGLSQAKKMEAQLFKRAINYLAKTKINNDKLIAIAHYILQRNT
jgi:geranylgeranyl pyrophosphate synthase